MTKVEAGRLCHGVYEVFWKMGGSSIAAVGSNEDGRRWFAPTNWIHVPGVEWGMIKFVKLIRAANP